MVIIVLNFVWAACLSVSLAQYNHPARPTNAQVIQALDRDGDNLLSPAELVNCKDCQFRCLCDGLNHALALTENNPDTNGDGKLSESEIPTPPDNADIHEPSDVTDEEIFEDVDIDESGSIDQKELRTCLKRQCHLNCPCKEILSNFTELAGSDNLLQISEIPAPEAPPGHEEITESSEEEEEEEEDERHGKKNKNKQKMKNKKKKARKQRRKQRQRERKQKRRRMWRNRGYRWQ